MNKICTIIALFFLTTSCATKDSVTIKKLIKTSISWDGDKISYPKKGQEEISSIYVTIAPKEILPYHCHPFPTLAYIISGKLEVEKMDGEKKVFNAGDSMLEVVKTWHRGLNLSAINDVEIVVFYVGQKSVSNTTMYNDKNKEKCHL